MPKQAWIWKVAIWSFPLSLAAMIVGWIFTEMGRQPFVVVPNPTGVDGVFMYTAQAVSPGVGAGQVLTSLIALTAVYGVLAVVEGFLLVRYAKAGVAGVMPPPDDKKPDDVLAFAY